MNVEANNVKYKIIKDEEKCFDKDEFVNKCTDYFVNFDYIVGDYAYSKLRLKGFNKKTNKFFNKINDYSRLDKYIKNNCAYGCKYFVLERENN